MLIGLIAVSVGIMIGIAKESLIMIILAAVGLVVLITVNLIRR